MSLRVNEGETNIMYTNRHDDEEEYSSLNLNRVVSTNCCLIALFKYLGVAKTSYNREEKEIPIQLASTGTW